MSQDDDLEYLYDDLGTAGAAREAAAAAQAKALDDARAEVDRLTAANAELKKELAITHLAPAESRVRTEELVELVNTHLAPELRAEVEVLKDEERKSTLEFSKRLLNVRRHKPD